MAEITKQDNTSMTIEGEHASVEVKTTDVDEAAVEQLKEMADHEAFGDAVVMPDAHAGAGAVVGFTMPLRDRLCPNTVGVDIGCGVTAARLDFGGGDPPWEWGPDRLGAADAAVRAAVPMGRSVYGDDGHPGRPPGAWESFPWDRCARDHRELNRSWGHGWVPAPARGWGPGFLTELCARVGYDEDRARDSLGTLGGGNHFVEVSRRAGPTGEGGDAWVVVHSGSRGLGSAVAEHWQSRATEATSKRERADPDEVIPERLLPYTDGWDPVPGEIRRDFDGEEIGEAFSSIREAAREGRTSPADRNTGLDYLEGAAVGEYLRDSLFAAAYASHGRRLMCRRAAAALGASVAGGWTESVHNTVDPRDAVVRKGATPAREGERGVVPFDMGRGAAVVEGLGNPGWNESAPHGAGRRGSRRWAREELSVERFREATEGVHTTNDHGEIIDEAPAAYKDADSVAALMSESARVVGTLEPVMNLKARDW